MEPREQFRALRIKLGTQAEAAKATGFSVETIYSLEAGRRDVKRRHLLALKNALRAKPTD